MSAAVAIASMRSRIGRIGVTPAASIARVAMPLRQKSPIALSMPVACGFAAAVFAIWRLGGGVPRDLGSGGLGALDEDLDRAPRRAVGRDGIGGQPLAVHEAGEVVA